MGELDLGVRGRRRGSSLGLMGSRLWGRLLHRRRRSQRKDGVAERRLVIEGIEGKYGWR